MGASERRRGRARGLLPWVVGLVSAALMTGVAAGVWVSHTAAGREMALDWLLSRAQPAINGTITAGSLGEGGLLGGTTLRDVALADSAGHPVLAADSMRARYSIAGLLGGDPVIADFELWSPVVDLAPAQGGSVDIGSLLNLGPGAELDDAATADAASDASGDGPALSIRSMRVHDAQLLLQDASGVRKRVQGINLHLPEVAIRPSRELFLATRAEDGALVYPLGTGALELSGIDAEIEMGPEGAVVRADRFLLPGSEGSGQARAAVHGDSLLTSFDLELSRLALSDLSWLDERLDHGTATGGVRIVNEPAGRRIELDGVSADLGAGGRVALDGVVVPGDVTLLQDFRVAPEGLAMSELEPYFDNPLEAPAQLFGEVLFEREADRLGVQGDLAAVSPATGDTLAHLGGGWRALGGGRAEELAVDATSLDYALLGLLAPGPEWEGRGALRVRADGDLRTGMAVEVAAAHALAASGGGLVHSDVTVAGSVYGDTAVSVLDLDATMAPLSIEALAALFPGLAAAAGLLSDEGADVAEGAEGLSGPVSGSLSLRGPLDQLAVDVDVETPAGGLSAQATINVPDPAAGYEVAASSERLVLSDLAPGLPDPTVVSGSGRLSGSGLDQESLRGALYLEAGPSVVGDLALDSAHVNAWVDEDGVLHVERLLAEAGGARVDGAGSIGAVPGAESEGIVLDVAASSIRPLRDLFMGGNLVAWDELPTIEQELLVTVDGADPDTFPRAMDIRFGGTADGRINLTGDLNDLTASANLVVNGFAYGRTSAGALLADVIVTGLGLPADFTDNDSDANAQVPRRATLTVSGAVAADSVQIRERTFQSTRIEGEFSPGRGGRAYAQIERSETESYAFRAGMTLAEGVGRIDLDALDLVFSDRRWNLRGPARFEWTPDEASVRDFDLVRTRGGGVELAANGSIARGSGPSSGSVAPESDLQITVADLDLDIVGRLLQLDAPPGGTLWATLTAAGPAADPSWEAALTVRDATYETLHFDSLAARGAFADRSLRTDVTTWNGARRSLHARGSLSVDLRLAPVSERITDQPVDLAIAADSFPARLLLGALPSLEEVQGQVSGNVDVGGTLADLEPDGSLRLERAAAFVTPFGIRLAAFDVGLDLAPSGDVRVTGTGASMVGGEESGSLDVSGTVGLGQLGDSVPLDLRFRARSFRIVDRPYMVAAVSTDTLALTGSWDFPFIEGAVDVEGGTVFMEEFQRTAEVVDLYDPELLGAATFAIGAEEDRIDDMAAARRSPFLQNLRVLVDLRVGRGSFLRSRQMNVETTGDLALTFDRRRNQLILQGDMEVSRGTYALGPRTLRITDGVFEFVGTPGFNPGLALTAENRLRTREGQPMVITADISGTLLSPFLTLSSDAEAAMSEAELLNYLVLGRPTSALVADAGAASVGAGRNLLLGQFANEIGYHLALELGVDYLSVSQAEQGQANAAFGASSLQVEVGRYVLDDVFLTAVYQRGFCADPTFPVSSGGVRVEMGMPRDVRLEGFLEGRCTRERYRGLGDAALALEHIWGFSFFREWGR